uniref:DUF5727 domain-containing protein n=1 Tax=Schistocephalus solidus TaxID=70667 RepID=A0A0X3NTM3_SCHSO
MAPIINFCLLTSLFCLSLSQTNELNIYREPGTILNYEDIIINFDDGVGFRKCIDQNELCCQVNNYRQTFTIPANTNIPTETKHIRVNAYTGTGAYIEINDAAPLKGLISLGRLHVQNNKVTKDTHFTAQFRVKGTTPQLELKNLKKETVVRLNGPMGSEPVICTFAANNDGGGETFKLNILPSTRTTSGSPTAIVGRTFVFLMLVKLVA